MENIIVNIFLKILKKKLKKIKKKEIEMDKLMKILKEARPDLDFEKENKLIDDEILDSFDIITIVGEINDAFDININVGDLVPENFNSAKAIWQVIQKYMNE